MNLNSHAEEDEQRFKDQQREIEQLKKDFYEIADMVRNDGSATSKAIQVMMKTDKAMIGLSKAIQELSMRVSDLEQAQRHI